MMKEAERASRRAAEIFAREPLRGVERLGSGHIHQTYAVTCQAGAAPFVLQRLNQAVFPDLDAVMANLVLVTGHLRAGLLAAGVRDIDRRCPEVLVTSSGDLLYRDGDGAVWRALTGISNSDSFDLVPDLAHARSGARCFGAYARVLAGMAPDSLTEVIPGFHDTAARMQALADALASDPLRRAASVQVEVDLAQEDWRAVESALAAGGGDGLPERVVHNDCKLNNVLFDRESGEALCAIDLDTTWRGTLLSDFGELVRTAACRAPEDERDLSRVVVDRSCIEALARGYCEGIAERGSDLEIEALPLGGPKMALENGVRFLADHVLGDVYYPARRQGHNLDRARAQLALCRRLLEVVEHTRGILRAIRAGKA